MHRLVGGHVEEECAGGLDDRGPPGPASAGGAAFVPAEPALECSAEGEEDRADEEGDADSGVADELRIAGERPDEEAGRAKSEEESHPAVTSHQADPRAPRTG